jgi:glyoxylase-like metal-dependent hydrolase (beta-lactamase superfamily II)
MRLPLPRRASFDARITTIALRGVNCYLISQANSYILVDTGFSGNRREIEKKLCAFGRAPVRLKLIVLTHGDSDHAGNAAYLRERFSAKIAMHPAEAPAVGSGDPAASRTIDKDLRGILTKAVIRLFPLRKRDRFFPDPLVGDGFDLAPFGFAGRIIHLPGHSQGSIGLATDEGAVFCGDLLSNHGKPGPGFGIFDALAFRSSLERIRRLSAKTIYPGHGKPFKASLIARLRIHRQEGRVL